MERSKTGLNSAAIAIWLLVQLAALAACADRITFWARSPAAGEQLALAVMLCVQIGASAVIFPYLLNGRGSTILAIVTGWPLAQLAAYLSDASLTQAAGGELYVSAWMLGLAFYSPLLRKESAKLIGAALATMVTLGGPLIFICVWNSLPMRACRCNRSHGSARSMVRFPRSGQDNPSSRGRFQRR